MTSSPTETRRLVRFLVLILATTACQAGASTDDTRVETSAPEIHPLPPALAFPEGITLDEQRGRVLVSSVEDGAVVQADTGSWTFSPFLPPGSDGRTAAYGMAVYRDRLVVAGGRTGLVFVYDLRTARLVARLRTGVEGESLVNDVTVAPDGAAYVTDSARPTLYGQLDRRGPDGEAVRPFTLSVVPPV